MKQLKAGNTYYAAKKKMYDDQKGICLICKRPLDPDYRKSHLDHDHALVGNGAGKVRGLLCILCNGTEGRFRHKFISSGLENKGVNYLVWMESLLEYLKKDHSKNDFHPQFITDTIKAFKRLQLQEMRDRMDLKGYEYLMSDKKADLVKKYSKQFRKEQHEL